MNLWRWNKGIAEDVVVQQSLPKGAPDWVARCEVPRRKGGDITHGMINDADTLRWLAQQNCITPHVWNARCDMRDQPDRLVFDLDPTGDDFNEIRDARARHRGAAARDRADAVRQALRLARHPRRRAAQAHAPGRRGAGGAQTLADRIAAEHPDTLTTAWRKEKRDGQDPRRRRPQHLRADDRRGLRGARAPPAPRSRRRSPGTRSRTPADPAGLHAAHAGGAPGRDRRPLGGHRRRTRRTLPNVLKTS